MSYCLIDHLQNYSSFFKLEEVTRTVQEVLSDSCQCDITADSIDEESFTCSEDSSNYVTYRARLSGTSEQDSASLISLIEDWVATGPTIRVQGVLMIVGDRCSATISDLSEGVCSSSGAQTDSTSTGAIVGGGVAVAVALILIVVVVIVFTVLTMRSRRGKFSLKKAEE